MRLLAPLLVAAAAMIVAPSMLLAQDTDESDLMFAPDDAESAAPPAAAPSAAGAESSPAATPSGVDPAPAAAAPNGTEPMPATTSAPEAAVTAEAGAVGEDGSITPRPPADTRVLGRYRVRISVAKPRFDDGLKFYKELYGDERAYPQFQADWFAWNWYATVGLSFRMAYYSAEGHTAKANKSKTEVVESDFQGDPPGAEKDEAGPTTLTLVPLQVLLATELTPFERKWVVVDAFAGLEYLYWQEVRTKVDSTSAIASPLGRRSLLAATSSDTADDGYTNTGSKKAMVLGVGLNFLLNSLDERSVASMRGSLGLGYVYLSPFLEVVRQLDDGVSFGRSLVGLGFTFESVR